jgi:hypothetical protein
MSSCLVSDPNADLIMQSQDKVLFKVYSKDLATHSGAFPSTENITSPSNEVVPLPESADVLELLFQFTRRQRQPNLKQIKFSLLSALTEAVEKYEVYSATEVCKAHMTCVLFLHTFPKTFQPPQSTELRSRNTHWKS